MMIKEPIQPPEEDKVTFATNWYDDADNIFQLIVSDYIWQQYGYDNKQPIPVIRKQLNPTHAVIIDENNGKTVGGVIFNPNEGTWNLYANEKYTGGGKDFPGDTF